jgi:hypothetical protein
MKLVADSRGRLTATNLFRPGAAYDASPQSDGSIRIIQLVEAEVSVVEPVEKDGLLLSPVSLSPEMIAAAIRAERDER